MHRIIEITVAAVILSLLAACTKEYSEQQGVRTSFRHEVTAEMPSYDMGRASAQTVVRVSWKKDEDMVYAINLRTGEVLGYLVPQESGNVAKLSGTLSGTLAEGDNIGYVYSPSLSLTQGEVMGAIDISLANQNAAKPEFVVYCSEAYDEVAISDKILKFSFATAMYHVNLSGMESKASIGAMKITNCADVCRFSISDNDIAVTEMSSDRYIAVNSIKTTNVEGEVTFFFAAPRMDNATRTIKSDAVYGKFDTGSTSSGAFYNVICSIWSDYPVIDLSDCESANCYIVSDAGKYRFRATRGNTTTSVGDVKGVKVLWESFGTSSVPTPGDMINPNVAYDDGYISFRTSAAHQGNAVIAAYSDADCTDGNVLWSWHVWFTEQPQKQTYDNKAGSMMDRNLGATSSAKGSVGALGLLYQWGRKEPFPGSDGITSATGAASTLASWPTVTSRECVGGTPDLSASIAYAVANPTTFIRYCDLAGEEGYNYDWYYTGTEDTDDTRWQTGKTEYDPCPPGWKVPDGGQNGVWDTAFGGSGQWSVEGNWDATNRGMDFGKTSMTLGTGTIWYPGTSVIDGGSGVLSAAGQESSYWSCTPAGLYCYGLRIRDDGRINVTTEDMRATGQPVRCCKVIMKLGGSTEEYGGDPNWLFGSNEGYTGSNELNGGTEEY